MKKYLSIYIVLHQKTIEVQVITIKKFFQNQIVQQRQQQTKYKIIPAIIINLITESHMKNIKSIMSPQENQPQFNIANYNRKTIVKQFCHYEIREKIGVCKLCFAVIQFRTDPIGPVFKHIKENHRSHVNKFRPLGLNATEDTSLRTNNDSNQKQQKLGGSNNGKNKIQAKKSPIELHFGYNRVLQQAMCRLCGQIFKVNPSNSKILYSHLKQAHPQSFTDNGKDQSKISSPQLQLSGSQKNKTNVKNFGGSPDEQESQNSISDGSDDQTKDKMNKNLQLNSKISQLKQTTRSKPTNGNSNEQTQIQEHFHYDQNTMRSMCKICGVIFKNKYGTTAHLIGHLVSKHHFVHGKQPGQIFPLQQSDNSKKLKDIQSNKNSRQLHSLVWEYFTREPINGKVTCKKCNTEKQYSGLTKSLLKHIKVYHEEELLDDWIQDNDVANSDEEINLSHLKTNHDQNIHKINKDDNFQNQQLDQQDILTIQNKRYRELQYMKKIQKQSLKDPQMKDILGRYIQNNIRERMMGQDNMQLRDIQEKYNFKVDGKKGLALCKLCECVFWTKKYGVSKFMKHISISHGLNIEECNIIYNTDIVLNTGLFTEQFRVQQIPNQRRDPRVIQNYQVRQMNANVFANPIHHIQKEEKQLRVQNTIIEQHIVTIANDMQQNFGGSTDEYLEYLSNLKHRHKFRIFHCKQTHLIKFYIFVKNIPQSDLLMYKKQISFWQYQNPVVDRKIHSIIYISAHKREIEPILLGMCILPSESIVNLEHIFNMFFQIVGFLPSQILICGSPKFKKVCQIVSRKIIKHQKLDYLASKKSHVVDIKENIFQTCQDQRFDGLLSKILQNLCQKQQETDSEMFLGFTLTTKYFTQLKNLTPDNFGLPKRIDQFLESCVKSLDNQDKILQKFEDKNVALNEAIIQKSLCCEEMKYLQKSLSPDIFLKLCYSFVYADLRLTMSEKQQCLFLVNEKQEEAFISQITQCYVAIDQKNNYWKCDCAINSLVGLPCPHIAKISIYYNNSLSNYIDPCWMLTPQNLVSEEITSQVKTEQIITKNGFIKNHLKGMKDFNQLFWS